jgi:hypothetical protein
MPIESNIEQLKKRLKKLRQNIVEASTVNFANEAKALMADGFNRNIDPYGNNWAIKSNGSDFDQNGVIEDAFSIKAENNKVIIENSLPQTVYLNYGTKNIPQRLMIPIEEKGLGNWKESFESAFHEAFETVVAGGLPILEEKPASNKGPKSKASKRPRKKK